MTSDPKDSGSNLCVCVCVCVISFADTDVERFTSKILWVTETNA